MRHFKDQVALKRLAESKWEHPRHYAGFSPDGDYLIVVQHRDSDACTRSNYLCAFRELQEVIRRGGLDDPPEERVTDAFPSRDEISPRSAGWVYDFRAGHPCVGWIEYLLVRADAPMDVLLAAGDILCSLDDYPVLNEDHFSELEWEEAAAFWESLSIRERLGMLRDTGIPCFAARHDYLPADPSGMLFERLTGC